MRVCYCAISTWIFRFCFHFGELRRCLGQPIVFLLLLLTLFLEYFCGIKSFNFLTMRMQNKWELKWTNTTLSLTPVSLNVKLNRQWWCDWHCCLQCSLSLFALWTRFLLLFVFHYNSNNGTNLFNLLPEYEFSCPVAWQLNSGKKCHPSLDLTGQKKVVRV